MTPRSIASRRYWLWLTALLILFTFDHRGQADQPPPPPMPGKEAKGSLPAEDVLLPAEFEPQPPSQRSTAGKPKPGSGSIVPSPNQHVVPELQGEYDTRGAGEMRIEQDNDRIVLTWDSTAGLSILAGTYQTVRFARDGGEFTRECFYGPWFLNDPEGNILRSGLGAVYPSPERDDEIICVSWEKWQGTWMDMKMGSFTKLSKTTPQGTPSEPNDDEGFY